jgi:hypothetical protein
MPPRASSVQGEEVGGSPLPFPDEEVCSGEGVRAVRSKGGGLGAPPNEVTI